MYWIINHGDSYIHTEEEFDDFDVPPLKTESTWKGWCDSGT